MKILTRDGLLGWIELNDKFHIERAYSFVIRDKEREESNYDDDLDESITPVSVEDKF